MPSGNAFVQSMGVQNSSIRTRYAEIMKKCTITSDTSVMLGDSTVKTVKTFDPARVHNALDSITLGLGNDWSIQATTTNMNDDKRRLFTKFSVTDSSITLSGHFSLQYHVLLYYTPNQRVIECQKELADLIENTEGHDERRAAIAEEIIKSKLAKSGMANSSEQEMFELFYNDDKLRLELTREINSRIDPNEMSLSEKKSQLYKELDTHILEVYSTSHVLIDEARLVGGEEGFVFSLDIQTSDGTFDPTILPEDTRNIITSRMTQISHALETCTA